MTDRRPRIPADLAATIDSERGDVPFERFVRRSLTDYFELLSGDESALVSTLEAVGDTVGSVDVLYAFIQSDCIGFDWKQFEEIVAGAKELYEAELDRQAREDEHTV